MDYPKSVPNVGLVGGKFVDENTTTGQVGSLIPATWGSAVTDEILNVIMGGGYVPDENENGQLLQAIKEIIADNIPPEKVRTTLAEYGITDAYTKAVTYTKDEIEAKLKNLSALPVGSMIGFPVDKVAPGFLELDGSVKSVATYPDLATFLGGAFNKGDEGAGNFRLPESRGEFLRGWDHGRGVDVGRGIGTWQKGSLHSFDIGPSNGVCGERSNVLPSTGENGRADLGYDATQAALYPFGAVAVANTGSINGLADNTEITYGTTRPRNLSVMWCIKAWNAPINQGNIDIAALSMLVAQATESSQGTAKVATDAQMLDSANDQVIATPKKLRKGFAISLTTNGYIAFPSWLGGLIIQWGQFTATNASGPVSFPIPFPNALLMKPVFGSENTTASVEAPAWQPGTVTTTGFTQISTTTHLATYLAIGY
jgi:hypothetical protein